MLGVECNLSRSRIVVRGVRDTPTRLRRITIRNQPVSVESRDLVDIERPCESVMPWTGRASGIGGRVTEAHLHIEQRTLEPGRPVVVWPGRHALYAAYDPEQISEGEALHAIALIAPGLPDLTGVSRAGEEFAAISIEDIAKHG